jgi:hypothetical protein
VLAVGGSLLVLVGCGESADSRAERAEANALNALNQAAALRSRVGELERRLAAVEARLRM